MRKKYLMASFMVALMIGNTIFDTSVTSFANNKASVSDTNGVETSEEINDPYGFDYLSLNYEIMEASPAITDETAILADIYDVDIPENTINNADDVDYPSSVDLTQNEYFPAVGDQAHVGNCGYWSSYYTNLTYSYNKANGIKTTPENTFNPFFGFKFYGKAVEADEFLSQTIGHPSIGVLPLDYNNMNTFTPYKEVWEDAVKHRILKFESYNRFGTADTLITGPKDSDLNEVKKLFNEGFLVGIGTLSGKWNFSVIPEGEFKGEKIVDRLDVDGLGGHGVSLVGYNDDIWTDINLDGVKQEAEMGAFKLVNSWGPDWCNKGFTWVAYDAFNDVSQALTAQDEQRINNDIASGKIKANKVNSKLRTPMIMYPTYSIMRIRDKSTSNCLCYMTVNTGSRKEMVMSVTATNKQTGKSSTYTFPTIAYDKVDYAWDGSTSSTDATFVFDLDNVVADITAETMEDYTWSVLFGDTTKDTTAVTVKDIYFGVNGVKKYVTSISKIPLNGTEKTYTMSLKKAGMKPDAEIVAENEKNVIIYYANSKFKDANIHYKTGSAAWTTAPGVQMSATDEQPGYTWKYVINLGSASSLAVCFNEKNKTWDSNGEKNYSITKPGCYGIKDGKISELEEVEIVEDPTIVFDKTSEKMMVGDRGIITPTVTDGELEDIVWTTSNKDVAIVTDAGEIYAVGAGTTTITASIGKVSASFELTVEEVVVTPTTVIEKPKADSVKLDQDTLRLYEGKTAILMATVTGESEDTVKWKSNDENVVVVSASGKVVGVGTGTATVTACIDEVSASCEVTVEKQMAMTTVTPTMTPTIVIEKPKADSVKLDQDTLRIYEGKTATLMATVTGESEDTVKWKSSNEDVVIVSANGKVIGVENGTAIVTAYIDGVSASCEVTVEKQMAIATVTVTPSIEIEKPKAASIKLNQNTLKLYAGKTATLKETIEGESEDTVKWKSSNENVVIVSANGKVIGVGKGTATVTAYIDEVSASCEVTVEKEPTTVTPPAGIEKPKADSIKLNQTILTLYEGKTAILVETVEGESEDTVKWKSSDENVVIVSENGKVIGVGKGTATVTAYIDEVSASCEVIVEKQMAIATVTPTIAIEKPKADSIKLNQETLKIYEGKPVSLVAMVEGESEDTVKWKSSNENVVIVSGNGKVIGVGEGTATVTACIDEVSVSCEVTVEKETVIPPTGIEKPKADSIKLDQETLKLFAGKTETLVAIVTGESEDTVKWKSSDENVAIVSSNGKVIGVGEGTATVTAYIDEVSASCEVTVEKEATNPSGEIERPNADSFILNKTKYTLYTAGSKKVTLTAALNGTKLNSNNVTWSSTNANIAKVNSKGVVTAKKAGKVVITAVTTNGLKAKCTITVKKPSIKLKTKSTVTLKEGKTLKIKAKSTPGGKFTYKTSSKKIATVSSKGVIKAKRKGTAYITVARNGVKKKIKVVVK